MSLHRYVVGLAALAAATCGFSAAHGALLGLDIGLKRPDIASFYVYTSYDPGTETFKAVGQPQELSPDSGSTYYLIDTSDQPLFYDEALGTSLDTSFSLMASVDSNGQAHGGTLTIMGKIAELGFAPTAPEDQILLTANLTRFGYVDPPGDEIFEFEFETTGGFLADSFGPTVGVALMPWYTGFDGTFASYFDNYYYYTSATADTAATPEPGSICLVVGAALGLLARRSGRRMA